MIMESLLALKSMIAGNEMLQKSTKKKENTEKSEQKSGAIAFKRSFQVGGTMAQLANARTKSQVDAIERSVRAQMQSMKKQSGSEEAIRQMKQVIAKARMKHQALSREEQLENNKKVARSAENKKQETRIAEELSRKRRSRMGREYADAMNAVAMSCQNKQNVSVNEQSQIETATIDISCDSFEASSGTVDIASGITIDTLL